MINLSHLGIDALNEMQEAMYATAIRRDTDVLLLSPTGTGKTLAFLLPLLTHLEVENPQIQAVVITPTRELAQQIEMVFKSLKTSFRVLSCYGGRSTHMEHKLLNEIAPHILIATPGRLKDHIEKENLSLSGVKVRIIDEFDKCLELGFEEEMQFVFSATTSAYATFLLSATDCQQVPDYIDIERSVRLDFLPQTVVHLEERIHYYEVKSPQKDKLETLLALLSDLGTEQSMVFVNHRESAERVYQYLKKKGAHVALFHGGLDQDLREKALYKFSGGSVVTLITTDLGARGLDLPDIKHIVHYHLPLQKDAYIHRNGRTARWENTGNVYLLLAPEETLPNYIENAVDTFPLNWEETPHFPLPVWCSVYIGRGKKDKISKGDIAGFFMKKGNFSPEDLGRIDVRDRYAYIAVKRKGIDKRLALLQKEKLKGQKVLIEKSL